MQKLWVQCFKIGTEVNNFKQRYIIMGFYCVLPSVSFKLSLFIHLFDEHPAMILVMWTSLRT